MHTMTYNSTFNERLAKDGSFKIHDRNLQKLLIEIFKVKIKLVPKIVNEVFDFIKCQCPLRNELRLKSRNIRTVRKLPLLLAPGYRPICPMH